MTLASKGPGPYERNAQVHPARTRRRRAPGQGRRYDGEIDLSLYEAADEADVLERFQALSDTVDTERTFGVGSSGLALLAAYCFEVLQEIHYFKEPSRTPRPRRVPVPVPADQHTRPLVTTATATGLPDGGGTILSAFPRRHRPPLEQASRVIQGKRLVRGQRSVVAVGRRTPRSRHQHADGPPGWEQHHWPESSPPA